MTTDTEGLGSWRSSERARKLVGFVLLLLSTATVLSNAYYLWFAEPAVSRKSRSPAIVAVIFVVGFAVRYS